MKPEPRTDEHGVPWCDKDKCEFGFLAKSGNGFPYTLCEVNDRLTIESQPTICQPAVREMAGEIERLKNELQGVIDDAASMRQSILDSDLDNDSINWVLDRHDYYFDQAEADDGGS